MLLFLLLLRLVSIVHANTEKTIFEAPSSIHIPNVHPGLDSLCLDVLSPHNSSLHVQLPVAFPSIERPRGTQSWYLLNRLRPGQRYELRVCWVATVSIHALEKMDTLLHAATSSCSRLYPQFGCLICLQQAAAHRVLVGRFYSDPHLRDARPHLEPCPIL
jgi:hypothetical protein